MRGPRHPLLGEQRLLRRQHVRQRRLPGNVSPNQTACQDNSQCCGSSVCCAIVTGGPVCKTTCTCSPHGGLCATDTDCCIGNSCQGGRCLETCGHANRSVRAARSAAAAGAAKQGACQCEAPGTACLESADCCAGTSAAPVPMAVSARASPRAARRRGRPARSTAIAAAAPSAAPTRALPAPPSPTALSSSDFDRSRLARQPRGRIRPAP